MDVHPPHEAAHSWRDALIHIAIMTVGLFIALMLEGLVEYAHHRNLVREARADIHQELTANQASLKANSGFVDKESGRVTQGITTLRYLQAHPDAHGLSIQFHWHLAELSDAAWITARDTGALSFMPYSEVEEDAGTYRLQEYVRQEMDGITTRQPEILAPMYAPGKAGHATPTDTQFDQMTQNAAVMVMDLQTLKQLMQGLDESYNETLNKVPASQ